MMTSGGAEDVGAADSSSSSSSSAAGAAAAAAPAAGFGSSLQVPDPQHENDRFFELALSTGDQQLLRLPLTRDAAEDPGSLALYHELAPIILEDHDTSTPLPLPPNVLLYPARVVCSWLERSFRTLSRRVRPRLANASARQQNRATKDWKEEVLGQLNDATLMLMTARCADVFQCTSLLESLAPRIAAQMCATNVEGMAALLGLSGALPSQDALSDWITARSTDGMPGLVGAQRVLPNRALLFAYAAIEAQALPDTVAVDVSREFPCLSISVPGSGTVLLEAGPPLPGAWTIHSLKKALVEQHAEDLNLSALDDLKLFCCGKELVDDKTLLDYGLGRNSRLELWQATRIVEVWIPEGFGQERRVLRMRTHETTTTLDVHRAVERELGIPIFGRQRKPGGPGTVVQVGLALEPNGNVASSSQDAALPNWARPYPEPSSDRPPLACVREPRPILELLLRRLIDDAPPVHIFVNTLTGKTITVPIESLQITTVGDLKAQIKDREGIWEDQQRLLFNGQATRGDMMTLSSCGVEANDTMHLVLRLRGGMFHASSARDDFAELTLRTGENPHRPAEWAWAHESQVDVLVVSEDLSERLIHVPASLRGTELRQHMIAGATDDASAAASASTVPAVGVGSLTVTVLTPDPTDFFFTKAAIGVSMGELYRDITADRPGRLFTVVPVRLLDEGPLEYLFTTRDCSHWTGQLTRNDLSGFPGGDRLCVRSSSNAVYELPQRHQRESTGHYFSAGGHLAADGGWMAGQPTREVCKVLTVLDWVHAGRSSMQVLQPLLEVEGTEWSSQSSETFFPQRDSRLFLIPDT